MPNPEPRIYHSRKSPLDLFSRGPLINVTVSLPLAVQQLRGQDQEEHVVALIDTGATFTSISDRLAATLGLVSTGRIPSIGVHGKGECNQYSINFTFTGSAILFENCNVVELTYAGQGFDMLIGRDVLQSALFVYNGATGEVGLEIPSSTDVFSRPPWGTIQSSPITQPSTRTPFDFKRIKQKRRDQKAARRKQHKRR